jgi:ketosteroid isomerase-like protein
MLTFESQNVELVKGANAASSRGDIPGLLQILASDVQWIGRPSRGFRTAGRVVGVKRSHNSSTRSCQVEDVVESSSRTSLPKAAALSYGARTGRARKRLDRGGRRSLPHVERECYRRCVGKSNCARRSPST